VNRERWLLCLRETLDARRVPTNVKMCTVRRSARTRLVAVSSSPFARWGGVAACLGGISYGAYGYFSDNPDTPRLVIDAVLPLLKLATPALFLGSLVGLHSWLGSRLGGGGSRLERAGVVVGLVGTVLGLLATVVGEENGVDLWATLPHLGGWWRTLLYTGLTVVGVATLVKDAPRLLGALVLASGTLGWVSLLTDPGFFGVLVPIRALHVAFAALFCLSCVVWGGVLFSEAS
jgi:hypothetical protein